MATTNGGRGKKLPEAVTIKVIRIIIYLAAAVAVIGIAGAIAALSIAIAPVPARQDGLTILVIGLGGLAVAGGIIYLAEKLINLFKGVAVMLFEIIAEKYKEHRYEVGKEEGIAVGMEEERQAWQAWYERQQAALRAGQPFNKPPPGYPLDDNKKRQPKPITPPPSFRRRSESRVGGGWSRGPNLTSHRAFGSITALIRPC